MINKIIQVENVTVLPKSAAKVAAGFLILTTVQYNPAPDVQRAKQAKFFEEPATFVKTQQPSNLVVLRGTPVTYNPATDVRRATQAKVFEEPAVFLKPQYSNPLVLAAFVTQPQIFQSVRNICIENASVVKAQKGTLVVLSQAPLITGSSDIFCGQDTYGWPKESAEPETFAKTQRGFPVITNAFTSYNPATDVRRAQQAKYFQDPEVFLPPTHINYVVNNTFPYNPAIDVTRLKHQALYFPEPDTFLKTKGPLSIALNFTAYVPGTDVRRQQQVKYFQEVEVFSKPWRNNKIVTEGTAGVPLVLRLPQDKLDAYDYMDGKVLLAWPELTLPAAQSYNVYVNGVLFASINKIAGHAYVLNLNAEGLTETLVSATSTATGWQAIVTGLTQASYNSGTQVITPPGVYKFKVVAVFAGIEQVASTEVTMSPSPTTVALVTPMKRLWPFGNSGLS